MSDGPPPGPTAHPSAEVDARAAAASAELAELRGMARLIDQTMQPFIAADFDGRITRTNRAFRDLVGYTDAELVGLPVTELTPDCWRDATRTALDRLQRTGVAQRYEKQYCRKDGRCVPVTVVTDFVRDERGKPCGYYAFVTDLTERHRAEQALREATERLQNLYDDAPFGYHEVDADGLILSVNRTECELLGYEADELVGRPIFDFIRPDQRDDARGFVRDRLEGRGGDAPVERTYRTRDGRDLEMQVESRLIRDADGRPAGLRSTMQDVTRRKQAEQALVASERRARALFEGIDDAVFVHDADGHILDANPAATRLLGYSLEEFRRLTTREIDDPEFAAGFDERLRRQMAGGHLNCEGRHRTRDGRIIPVEISTSVVELDRKPAVLAVIRDVSERKALEETRRKFAEAQLRNAWEIEAKNRELIRSEARYRKLAEGTLDAIVVVDAAGNIGLFNPAAARTFGYDAAEILGRPLALLIPDSADDEPPLRQALLNRDPRVVGQTVERQGRRKDGAEFPLEISLSAVDLEGETQFIGSIRDQTERQRMRAMLVQSDRLASIGLLSAGVAHEINNPLSYIANNLAVLERDLGGVLDLVSAYEAARPSLPPEALAKVDAVADELDWEYVRDNLGRMLARTREGVQRVATIVQNLRGLARTSAPKLEPAFLKDLIESALEMVQGRVRRDGIALEVDAPPLPKLACVPAQISQVILNLVVNAIQAVEQADRPGGGTIRVVARPAPGAQVLEVVDDGVGIDPAAIPHLFDPFYTTKPVGEGTGLGLSISHGIITGHGGRIEVESRPGVGTTFRVVLPVNAARLKPGGPPSPHVRPGPTP